MSSYHKESGTPSLHPATLDYLAKVYSLLVCGIGFLSLGYWLDVTFFHWGGLYAGIVGMLTFGIARQYPISSPSDRAAPILFLVACAIQGMSLSPLIHSGVVFYRNELITAIIGTISIFISLTVAAIFSPKSKITFFLYSVLGTAASLLSFTSLMNLFMRSPALFDMNIYVGLFVTAGYVFVNTTLMISRFEANGSYHYRSNYVRPACDLFADLVGLFVRLLVFLIRQKEKTLNKRFSGVSLSPVHNSNRHAATPPRTYYKRPGSFA